ncbi:MAG: carbohydrate porin [Thermodesulfobacteriota bacterium]|nr:carbohydrate porin [Thermodesulfobacteriota bacterium]
MNKMLLIFALVIGVTFYYTSYAFAGDYMQEIEGLKKRIEELEKNMEASERDTKEIKAVNHELECIKKAFGHLNIGVGITGIVQGTANNDDNNSNVIDGSYSVDLEIEADMKEWGTAFIHLEAGDGENVADEVEALTGVNADALGEQNDLEVAEAWWEFSLLDEYVTFTVGKLDPVVYWDANEIANDETAQFLADIFVNSIIVEWPDYTPGFHLLVTPNEFLDIRFGILSADSDWEDIFEDIFAAGGIDIKPKFGNFTGNYRFYGWINALDHIKWNNWLDGERLNKKAYHDDKVNSGFGLSFDQQITSDIILFCRFGLQEDDIAGESYEYETNPLRRATLGTEELDPFALRYSWSIGGQITGNRWGRPGDVLGIAFGQAIISSDYERYLRDEGVSPEDESHFEAYYSFRLNESIAISPDIQVITNMGGDDDADTVTVFGVRTQINF